MEDQTLHLAIKAFIGHGAVTFDICALIKALLMSRENGNSLHFCVKGTMNKSLLTDLLERNVNIALKNNYLRKHTRNTIDFVISLTSL